MSTSRIYEKLQQEQEKIASESIICLMDKEFKNANEILSQFCSTDIMPILTNKNVSINESHFNILPMLLLFYRNSFAYLCPHCECVKNPNSLVFLLQRNATIPVLIAPLHHYPSEFIDLISAYPHLTAVNSDMTKYIRLTLHELNILDDIQCPGCYSKATIKFIDTIKKLPEEEFDRFGSKVHHYLRMPSLLHYKLLEKPNSILDDKEYEKLKVWESIISGIGQIENTIALSAMPLMSESGIQRVSDAYVDCFCSRAPDVISEELLGSALNRLGLVFSSDVSLDEYYRIIEPHRGSLYPLLENKNESVNSFMESIDRVNYDVKKIASSRRRKIGTFVTSFIMQNPTVLSILIGGGAGLLLDGAATCGIGAASLGGASLARRFGKIVIPEQSKREFYDEIKPITRKLLSLYFAKDLPAIHLWELKKKIKAINGDCAR